VGWDIRAPQWAAVPYVAAASFASFPGLRLDTRTIPLEADWLFFSSLTNTAPFAGFRGVLDGGGRASMTLTLPSRLPLPLDLYAAYVTLDPGAPNFIRNISNTSIARLR